MSRQVRHYPTPITTTYYIGEYLIDDMFRVDFTRKVTDQPVWGYASKQFDFVAKGREIVSGNIIINFRYPGYLTNVIAAQWNDTVAKDSFVKSGYGKESEKDNSDIQGESAIRAAREVLKDMDAVDSNAERMRSISDALLNNNLSAASANSLASSPRTIEINLAAQELKEALNRRYLKELHSDDTQIKHLESPLTSARGVLFDLAVQYGFQGVAGGWRRLFKDIVLIGESQVVQAGGDGGNMASSAQNFIEVYPFFCRTIETERYHG